MRIMTTSELETRAERALTETLRRMSGVDVKEMRRAWARSDRPSGILVRMNVLGHSHTLACTVEHDGDPAHIHVALRDSFNAAPHLTESATAVIIAPYLPPEAQTACKDAGAGFLDLVGNARLSVGELFIAERSLPSCVTACAAAISPRNNKGRKVPRLHGKQRYRNPSNSRRGNDTEILEGESSQDLAFQEAKHETVDAQPGKELSQRGSL